MAYIYTLSDSLGVRYIGKTNNINMRYKNHINESKKVNRRVNHRTNWILSLIKNGELPIIEIIDIVPDSEWVFWEIFWIGLFKSWGFNLVNGTLGGENPPTFLGKTHSDEYKNIRSKIMSTNNPSKKMDDNWRYNISKSTKGRVFSKKHIENISIPIVQLTLDDKIICEWTSASMAGRTLKISINSIGMCCRGKRKTCGGFKWKRKT